MTIEQKRGVLFFFPEAGGGREIKHETRITSRESLTRQEI